MESETVQETKTVLKLSEEERVWLAGMMQNPLHGGDHRTEPTNDREMRLKFWKTLNYKP